MSSHFKKNEVKNAEQRRKKMEQERENLRKSKKLNYLITRTELYSHFMAKRIGDEVGDVGDVCLRSTHVLCRVNSRSVSGHAGGGRGRPVDADRRAESH